MRLYLKNERKIHCCHKCSLKIKLINTENISKFVLLANYYFLKMSNFFTLNTISFSKLVGQRFRLCGDMHNWEEKMELTMKVI